MDRLGIDVGGTFTDLVDIQDGEFNVHKVPSTPSDPASGVLSGFERIGESSPLTALQMVAHGTTVGTNAVLEEELATTALVTTEGFRDVLEIGRQARPDIYDLHATKPDPIIPRHLRFTVPERLDERGEVKQPLEDEAVESVIETCQSAKEDIASIAISLLFSYENDIHERKVLAAFDSEGFPYCSLSSAIFPEIREYERTLVTALNAGLQPVMEQYLSRIQQEMTSMGIPGQLRIMGSNGGILDVQTAKERPVETVLSGPAAGVRGAAYIGANEGFTNLVTLDMGGTSCDVSLVLDGEPHVSTDVTVGEYPVPIPMVDIHTIGAGGGSIAWIDTGDALRVGPETAGASPGPICYGRGGQKPTVTDAQYLLGRLRPDSFAGNIDGSEEACRIAFENLGNRLGKNPIETARGVIEVATSNMAQAVRVMSVERGYNPKSFALLAFGGAGPVHGSQIAEAVGIPTVIFPRAAGVLSAIGLLVSNLTYEISQTRIRPLLDVDSDWLEDQFHQLESEGEARAPDGIPIKFKRVLTLQYHGQSFDIRVEHTGPVTEESIIDTIDKFHAKHKQRYGHASVDEPVELVSIRVRTIGIVEPPDMPVHKGANSLQNARVTTRSVWFETGEIQTPIYAWEAMPVGSTIDGPAIIEGVDSTVVLQPHDSGRVTNRGTIILDGDDNK